MAAHDYQSDFGFRAGITRHRRKLLCCLLTGHAILLAYSGAVHSPVIDEPAHLAAGLSHWQLRDFSLYRVNPPLVRMVATAPLLGSSIRTDWSHHSRDPNRRSEVAVGIDLIRANEGDVFRYFTVARWACIPFSLIGAVICYRWARILFGNTAGLLATTLWCCSPTVLGNGSLITPDCAATAMGLAACYAFFRWLISPSLKGVIFTGILLGAAEACKSTWIILFALFPGIWLLYRVKRCKWSRKPHLIQLMAIILMGWWLLNTAYEWRGVGSPVGSLSLRSKLFQRLLGEETDSGKHRVRLTLAKLPLPVPLDYAQGLDIQKRDLEGPNRSYLRGEWRNAGWWHYYAYGLVVKEPVSILISAALSLGWWLRTVWSSTLRARISARRLSYLGTAALVALCPLAVFIIASAQTGMNHHVRYVMPVVPYLYILASGLLLRSGDWRVARWFLSLALAAFTVASSFLTFPHSLSYFNEIAGGPSGGVKHLNNSNIDWGQDLLLLKKWKENNVPDEPIHLAYFGRVNPSFAGIDYVLPPILSASSSADLGQNTIRELRPGWYAVSATLLQGRAFVIPAPTGGWVNADFQALSYFQKLQSVDRVGYSIYIYKINDTQAVHDEPSKMR